MRFFYPFGHLYVCLWIWIYKLLLGGKNTFQKALQSKSDFFSSHISSIKSPVGSTSLDEESRLSSSKVRCHLRVLLPRHPQIDFEMCKHLQISRIRGCCCVLARVCVRFVRGVSEDWQQVINTLIETTTFRTSSQAAAVESRLLYV